MAKASGGTKGMQASATKSINVGVNGEATDNLTKAQAKVYQAYRAEAEPLEKQYEEIQNKYYEAAANEAINFNVMLIDYKAAKKATVYQKQKDAYEKQLIALKAKLKTIEGKYNVKRAPMWKLISYDY